MSMRIGFLRAEEIREPKSYAKQERVELESVRVAYEERRWLLIRLIDSHASAPHAPASHAH